MSYEILSKYSHCVQSAMQDNFCKNKLFSEDPDNFWKWNNKYLILLSIFDGYRVFVMVSLIIDAAVVVWKFNMFPIVLDV